jgi:hypothetical protein
MTGLGSREFAGLLFSILFARASLEKIPLYRLWTVIHSNKITWLHLKPLRKIQFLHSRINHLSGKK